MGFALPKKCGWIPTRGHPSERDVHDYKVLKAADVAVDRRHPAEHPDAGPHGAKGVGEVGIVPVPGALANRADAIGTRVLPAPMTPERVCGRSRA